MASITIRNLDDNIKAKLRIQAAQHGLSMEQEAREILRTSLDKPANSEGTFLQRIRARFAGYDLDAVKQARTYLMPFPPSSPCVALMKDGQVVHMIERHMIEGRSAQMIAANLAQAFEQFC